MNEGRNAKGELDIGVGIRLLGVKRRSYPWRSSYVPGRGQVLSIASI
jgi:hypothetical protein